VRDRDFDTGARGPASEALVKRFTKAVQHPDRSLPVPCPVPSLVRQLHGLVSSYGLLAHVAEPESQILNLSQRRLPGIVIEVIPRTDRLLLPISEVLHPLTQVLNLGVAGSLATALDRPVQQPGERVKREDRAGDALEERPAVVPPADVDQFVGEDGSEGAGRLEGLPSNGLLRQLLRRPANRDGRRMGGSLFSGRSPLRSPAHRHRAGRGLSLHPGYRGLPGRELRAANPPATHPVHLISDQVG